jgi:hypothetical protein
VSNTGNDAREAVNFTDLMSVHVWDGFYPGFGWDNGSTTNNVGLPSGSYDPDVSLVEGYSIGQVQYTWYAIVVYEDQNTGYCMCRIYEWDQTNKDFTSITPTTSILYNGTYLGYGTYTSSINIDADASGNFVIVWDDGNTYDIQIIGGTTFGSSTSPQFCNSGNSLTLSNTYKCFSPDVSLYSDPGHSTSIVHYTYTDVLTYGVSTLYVASNDFNSDVCVSSTSASSTINYNNSLSSSDYFGRPRIACPSNIGSSSSSDWSAVALKVVYGGGADIINFTNYGSTVYTHVYTDGSITGLCHITGLILH